MIANSNAGSIGLNLRNASIGMAAFLFCTSASYAAELIWTGDFETGDFSQYKDKLYGSLTTKKRLVTSPVRGGRYATELTVLDIESNSDNERAELLSQMETGGKILFQWDGPEYWLGFSFLFKEPIATVYTFFQLHAPSNKGDPCGYDGNTFSVWGGGAASNGGVVRDVVVRVLDDGGVSDGKGAGSNNSVVYRYPFPLNEWQDYVVNFRLSTTGKGFYKIWKNGKLIYSESGLTNVNYRDSCGNLVPEDERRHDGAHIGIYTPNVTGYRRIFYDEVRVATGSDGYSLVAPGESGKSESPVASAPNPPIVHED